MHGEKLQSTIVSNSTTVGRRQSLLPPSAKSVCGVAPPSQKPFSADMDSLMVLVHVTRLATLCNPTVLFFFSHMSPVWWSMTLSPRSVKRTVVVVVLDDVVVLVEVVVVVDVGTGAQTIFGVVTP